MAPSTVVLGRFSMNPFRTPLLSNDPPQTPASSAPLPARISKPPIHNPYNKFTQSQFDQFVDDITSALKKALNHEHDPPARSFDTQRWTSLLNDGTPRRSNGGILPGQHDDSEEVQDSFAELKSRRAKGKARDPREGPGFGDQQHPIELLLDSDEEQEDQVQGDDDECEPFHGHSNKYDSRTDRGEAKGYLSEDHDGTDGETRSKQYAPEASSDEDAFEISADEDDNDDEQGFGRNEDMLQAGPSNQLPISLRLRPVTEDFYTLPLEDDVDEAESYLSTDSLRPGILPDRKRDYEAYTDDLYDNSFHSDAADVDASSHPALDEIPSFEDFPPYESSERLVEIEDPWDGPRAYAEDLYTGGDRFDPVGASPSHLTPSYIGGGEDDEITMKPAALQAGQDTPEHGLVEHPDVDQSDAASQVFKEPSLSFTYPAFLPLPPTDGYPGKRDRNRSDILSESFEEDQRAQEPNSTDDRTIRYPKRHEPLSFVRFEAERSAEEYGTFRHGEPMWNHSSVLGDQLASTKTKAPAKQEDRLNEDEDEEEEEEEDDNDWRLLGTSDLVRHEQPGLMESDDETGRLVDTDQRPEGAVLDFEELGDKEVFESWTRADDGQRKGVGYDVEEVQADGKIGNDDGPVKPVEEGMSKAMSHIIEAAIEAAISERGFAAECSLPDLVDIKRTSTENGLRQDVDRKSSSGLHASKSTNPRQTGALQAKPETRTSISLFIQRNIPMPVSADPTVPDPAGMTPQAVSVAGTPRSAGTPPFTPIQASQRRSLSTTSGLFTPKDDTSERGAQEDGEIQASRRRSLSTTSGLFTPKDDTSGLFTPKDDTSERGAQEDGEDEDEGGMEVEGNIRENQWLEESVSGKTGWPSAVPCVPTPLETIWESVHESSQGDEVSERRNQDDHRYEDPGTTLGVKETDRDALPSSSNVADNESPGTQPPKSPAEIHHVQLDSPSNLGLQPSSTNYPSVSDTLSPRKDRVSSPPKLEKPPAAKPYVASEDPSPPSPPDSPLSNSEAEIAPLEASNSLEDGSGDDTTTISPPTRTLKRLPTLSRQDPFQSTRNDDTMTPGAIDGASAEARRSGSLRKIDTTEMIEAQDSSAFPPPGPAPLVSQVRSPRSLKRRRRPPADPSTSEQNVAPVPSHIPQNVHFATGGEAQSEVLSDVRGPDSNILREPPDATPPTTYGTANDTARSQLPTNSERTHHLTLDPSLRPDAPLRHHHGHTRRQTPPIESQPSKSLILVSTRAKTPTIEQPAPQVSPPRRAAPVSSPSSSTSPPSSVVTRSHCRYHRISLPSEDGSRVRFVVPGCSLNERTLMEKKSILDLGYATMADGDRMIADLESLDLNSELIGVLRQLVGVDLLREQEVYYLPAPGETPKQKPPRAKAPLSAREALKLDTDNLSGPSRIVLKRRRSTTTTAASPRAPLSALGSVSSSFAGSTKHQLASDSESSTSSRATSEANEPSPDASPPNTVAGDEAEGLKDEESIYTSRSGRKGPTASSSRRSTRRIKRLSRDALAYNPKEDVDAASQEEDIRPTKSRRRRARRATKRPRTGEAESQPPA